MKYVILIYSNPASRALWETMTEAQRAPGWKAYADLNAELAASGEMIVAEALADPSLARRITVSGEELMSTDGPMAEVKEVVAGFYLLECDSIERATEIAARIPEAAFGLVEVRPVMSYRELDEPDERST